MDNDQVDGDEQAARETFPTSGWAAHFFPGERMLRVGGNVTVPTKGYSLRLSDDINQGINPWAALRLVIVATAPSDPVAQVTTEEPVQFEREVGRHPLWPVVEIVNSDPPASVDVETAEEPPG
jgi:hypothetical protein